MGRNMVTDPVRVVALQHATIFRAAAMQHKRVQYRDIQLLLYDLGN